MLYNLIQRDYRGRNRQMDTETDQQSESYIPPTLHVKELKDIFQST